MKATVVDVAPGEYTVEYCWLDYETGPRCHTENIVIPEEPYIAGYSNSGCLPGDGGGRELDVGPCTEDDEIELIAGPGTLDVMHWNATYNCCPDDIVISLSVEGNVLELTEEEVLTNPCYCICCYNVEATIAGLSPGLYTVQFCWYDWETQGESCHREEIVIP